MVLLTAAGVPTNFTYAANARAITFISDFVVTGSAPNVLPSFECSSINTASSTGQAGTSMCWMFVLPPHMT